MANQLLNRDGTVNLQAAHDLKSVATRELHGSLVRLRAAERAYDIEWNRNRWAIACGRAEAALEAARANHSAAYAACRHADGVIWEAMNPELA